MVLKTAVFLTFFATNNVTAAQPKAPPPQSVQAGKYRCVFFINGALQNTPGFTILGGGAYQHDSGSKGKFTYDASRGLLTFEGGSLDKQAARVEQEEKRGIIRLYNERRSRTVIDCDTPRR